MSGETRQANGDPQATAWEFDYRPKKLRVWSVVVAVVVLILHILWALTLTAGRDTGVHIGGADQLAFVAIGLILAGLILLLLRIRVRAGAQGIELSGLLRAQTYGWDDIVGFTFPLSAQWARLELPAYEHVGIPAIQAMDGEPAVDAMHALRDIAKKYKPSAADPGNVADR